MQMQKTCEGQSARDGAYTVSKLREELRRKQLSDVGKRDELVKRLCEDYTKREVSNVKSTQTVPKVQSSTVKPKATISVPKVKSPTLKPKAAAVPKVKSVKPKPKPASVPKVKSVKPKAASVPKIQYPTVKPKTTYQSNLKSEAINAYPDSLYFISLDDPSAYLPLIREFRPNLARLFKSREIQHLRSMIQRFLEKNLGKTTSGFVMPVFNLMFKAFDNPVHLFGQTCHAIANELSSPTDGGVPLPVTPLDVCILQVYYELSAMCTSIVTKDKNSSLYIHGRTMDWDMDDLKSITIQVVGTINGKCVCKGLTWVGMIGFFTAMSINCDSPISVSINYRSRDLTKEEMDSELRNIPIFGNQILNICNKYDADMDLRDLIRKIVLFTNPKSMSVASLVKDLVTKQYTAEEAKLFVEKQDLISPAYFTICGTKQGFIIARDPIQRGDPYEQTLRESWQDKNIGPREKRGTGYICIPNKDWWNPKSYNLMSSITRLRECDRVLQNPENRTIDSLWGLLQKPPIKQSITIYSCIMIPETGEMFYTKKSVPNTIYH